MKPWLKILLTFLIWSATIGAIVSATKDPMVFIQLWITKAKHQEIQKQCKGTTEIRIDYPEGDYAILPCRVVQSGK